MSNISSSLGTHRSAAANDLAQHCCEWLYYNNDDTRKRLEADTVDKLTKSLKDNHIIPIPLSDDRWDHTCGGRCIENLLGEFAPTKTVGQFVGDLPADKNT
eukprot:5994849-Karenia_brevis.AAC.1